MEQPVQALKHFISKCSFGKLKLLASTIIFVAFIFQSNKAFAKVFDSTITILCNDVTDGGEITGNESGCNNPIFDPSIITSVELPSGGGTEPIEYLWIYTNDDPTGTFAIWHPIPGSSESFYDPGPISETTYYRRCAKRAGCPEYLTESNWVCKEIECNLPNIGDTVFVDENGNGIQDPGEPGVAGVKVKLMAAGPDNAFCTPDDVMVTMQVTGANGMYLFMDVQPGTYYIEFCEDTLPTGYTFTTPNQGTDDGADSDADPDTGKTNVFTVNYGDEDDLSYDAGVVPAPKTKLGDTVFADNNGNGIQDAGEPGVSNIKVKLFNDGIDGVACNNDDEMVEMVFTDTNGNYSFTICDVDTYYIKFCDLPAGYEFTDQNVGNDATDSDADPSTGKTDPIDVDPSDPDNPTIDAGVVPICDVNFTIASTDPTCHDSNDGTATVNTTSGTAPFTYSWSESFGNGQTATGIGGGIVCVTVTDANGCSEDDCATFINPQEYPFNGDVTDAACGENDGSITIAGPIESVVWNTGATTLTINNLAPGQYCATTTFMGCPTEQCFDVGSTGNLDFTLNSHDADCVGGASGTAFVFILSGTEPYTYLWSNGETTPAINNAVPGEYCITVTDAEGCQEVKCTTIGAPAAIEITGETTDATCGDQNGSVSIDVSGGTAPYTFVWNGVPTLTSEDLIGLAAGTYCVLVTDFKGCTSEQCFDVGTFGGLDINVLTTDARCSDSNDGIAIVAFSGNFTGPYDVSWSDGLVSNADGSVRNLAPGNYCVTVTDAFGCVDNECFEILAPQETIFNIFNLYNCGTQEGELFTTVYNGDPSEVYTYAWSNGPTTEGQFPVFITENTTYCVTVTDESGCTVSGCTEMIFKPIIEFEGTVTDAACGENNGSITTQITTGIGPFTYEWNHGPTSADLSNLAAGTYCLRIKAQDLCVTEECFTVGSVGGIEINVQTTDAKCSDSNDGNALVSINSDAPRPITFDWSGGITSMGGSSAVNLAPGDYCVTVTDGAGCQDVECFTISAPGPIVVQPTITHAACGEANGSISFAVIGGTPPLSYDWGIGQAGPTIINLAAGTYCITVTDAALCVHEECFTVNGESDIVLNITANDPTCHGSNDGSTSATTSGGTPPVSIDWSNGATGNTVTGLGAGEICATATDAAGCTMTQCVTLVAPAPLAVTGMITDATCGEENGSIVLSTTGGTGAYSYSWFFGATSSTVNGLGATDYCVTVTDANGCTTADCFEVLDTDFITDFDLNSTSLTCNGGNNGTATVSNIIGETSSMYLYEWSNGATTSSVNNLPAGEICVQVYAATFCVLEKCITINAADPITFDLDISPTECGFSTGMADVDNFMGGTAPYTYLWSNGATTQSITNLFPIEYCVTVTDANGCNSSQCGTVGDSSFPTFDLDHIDATCGENNGSAEASNFIGGIAPFTFQWDHGPTTAAVNNLAAGEYCLVVTDALGCTNGDCVTVNGGSNIIVNLDPDDPSCHNSNTGFILVDLMGGTSPFSYVWSDGGEPSGIRSGLSPGEYCVTVTDGAGCTETDCVTLANPPELTFDVDIDDSTCGENNGNINVNNITNGLAPFDYVWNTGATTASISNLSAGQYCVTVSDDNGCASEICIIVGDSNGPTANASTVTNGTCGEDSGSVIVIENGGTAPYTYLWNTGATTPAIANLAAGEYCATVTDANGCTATDCTTVLSDPGFGVNGTLSDPTCGEANGSVTFNAVGGAAPITYEWNVAGTTGTINNLGAGTYCVTITDANGCTYEDCATLIGTNPISTDFLIGDAQCDEDNGSLEVNPSGGSGPYTYIWNTGATTPRIQNLASGDYCVTITDTNGCTLQQCEQILSIGGVGVSLSGTDPTCGASDGSVTATVTGGTLFINYSWNVAGSTDMLNNLSAGTYCVTVQDEIGCTADACITLNSSNGPTLGGSGINTTCGESNGSATVNATGGTSPYTYAWTGGGTGSTLNNLAAGNYCVTVTDGAGCTEEMCYEILPSNPNVVTPFGPETLCPGEEGAMDILSALGTNTFEWSSNGGIIRNATGTANSFQSNTPGTYTITVVATDENGCIATAMFDIRVKTPAECGMEDKVHIGNYVWFDIDKDGIQDPFEQGVSGVKVKLISAGTDGAFNTADDMVVDMQMTDDLGYYLFECVEPGTYIIEFCLDSLPADTELTTQDTGTTDENDSDANPTTGQTDPFTVVVDQDDDLSFDAGIIIDEDGPCDNLLSGGEICCDQVLCGAGSTADPITSVTPASGGSGTLEYLWMMTTNPGPFDPNTWTMIPGATGMDLNPGPIFQTTLFARCARRAGCTNYLEANLITIEIKDLPTAAIIGLPTATCLNESISFSAADGGVASQYSWNFGADASPSTYNGRNVSAVQWSTPGTKTVTLTVTRLGCERTVTQDIIVEDCTGARFMNFTAAAAADEQVALEWETNEDLNDFVFIIEHSVDGENFKIISDMQGNMIGQDSKRYTYMDKEARPGRNFYKVKHIDFTGESVSTDEEMIIIHEDAKKKFILFPVPTLDVVNFETLKLTDNEGKIQVVDAYGHTLDELTIPANTERLQVDLSPYPTGTYFLYIRYDSVRMQAHKVIKIRE